jgi:membrane peptidoglycan carboxypeptidase
MRWSDALGVPPHFLQILLLVEDKRFPIHLGLDPLAVARAALRDLEERRIAEGASTLTQQLYDINEGPLAVRPTTWRRKVRQAGWALKAECRTSKREILRDYLAAVYWGRSYFGLSEAALGYFGRSKGHLSRTESLFLVERLGSPNSPLPSRIASILQRRAVRDAVFVEQEDQSLLAEHYEAVFGIGDGMWRSLAKCRKQ